MGRDVPVSLPEPIESAHPQAQQSWKGFGAYSVAMEKL